MKSKLKFNEPARPKSYPDGSHYAYLYETSYGYGSGGGRNFEYREGWWYLKNNQDVGYEDSRGYGDGLCDCGYYNSTGYGYGNSEGDGDDKMNGISYGEEEYNYGIRDGYIYEDKKGRG